MIRFDNVWRDVVGPKTYKRRTIDEIVGVMIHRVGKDFSPGATTDFGNTAEEICQEFTDGVAAPYTGSKVPYSFIVEDDGRVAQCLPLSWVGPHALKMSRGWLSVALIGDFRYSSPSNEQFGSAVILVRSLLGAIGQGVGAVQGHTDVPGATSDSKKVCPGECLNLYELKSAITGGFAL